MKKYGLGPGIIGRLEILPYAKLFRIGARYHDISYLRGGLEHDRIRADNMFYRLCKSVCKTRLQKYFAYIYYILVKKFGFLYFNYK